MAHHLVTGGTGFIGYRLVRRLRADGHDVTVLVRDPRHAKHLTEAGARVVRGDVRDRISLDAAFAVQGLHDEEPAHGLFHLAAWYKIGVRDERAAHREADATNVEGTRNVCEAMQEAGIPKGVYTSTLAVYGDTKGRLAHEHDGYSGTPAGTYLSHYDRTKWLAHHDVVAPMQDDGLPMVVVQPGVVYGPDDPSSVGVFLRRYLRRKLPAVPKRTAACWCYIDDIVDGHVRAMERGQPGEDYNLAGPPHTFEHVLEVAKEITGIPLPRSRTSPMTLRFLARVMRLLQQLGMQPQGDLHPEVLRVMAGTTYLGSYDKAKRELGYKPRSLQAGLKVTLPHEMKGLGIKPTAAKLEPTRKSSS